VLGRAHLLLDLVAEHRAADAAEIVPTRLLPIWWPSTAPATPPAAAPMPVPSPLLLDFFHRNDGADDAGLLHGPSAHKPEPESIAPPRPAQSAALPRASPPV
jgi:hypothetical protein